MSPKNESGHAPPDTRRDRKSFWQPPELRGKISPEGEKWLEENADAMTAWNEWVEKNGIPLQRYRAWPPRR